MIVAAHQLHYLPWIRYFDKITRSDTFVILDNIQYNKNGWQNRNKIKSSQGWMHLTVPVKNQYQQRLNEVEIDSKTNWRKKHWKSLLINYDKAGHFKKYKDFFQELYQKEWVYLNDLNYHILLYLIDVLGIKTEIIRGSELNVEGEATERLVNICKTLGADTYLSGAYASQVYLDVEMFRREGIKLLLQEWDCPQYCQQFSEKEFIPDLSIVDLLFNYGDKSLDIILKRS